MLPLVGREKEKTMATYIDLSNAKNIAGSKMIEAKKGTFLKVIIDGEKKLVRANTSAIDPHGVYSVKMNRRGEAIIRSESGWSCSKEEYDGIMKDGQDVLNRIFGDVFGDVIK